MAIARDSSSTAGVNLISNGTASSATTASFSPPDNTIITIIGYVDTNGSAQTWTPSNTGTALNWINVIQIDNVDGGSAVGFSAINTSLQTITVSLSVNNLGTSGDSEGTFWTDVWTGANPSQVGAATNSGLSTSTNFNGTVTTTQTGSYVVGGACDDSQLNTPTSTDLYNSTLAQHADGIRVYKSAPSGSPGSVTLNFQAPVTPIWGWIGFEILPAPIPVVPTPVAWLTC